MAYDEALAERIAAVFFDEPEMTSKKMFGGIAFMVDGHMAVGVVGDDLLVRLSPDEAEQALKRKHVRQMDFTGRPMKGYVYVAAAGLRGKALEMWVRTARDFVATLPRKVPKRPRASE
ncbi:MAG TPA: TfoX/Sxy family protein [Miltoncostaeales bacterium]|jgi:TfoX/Sxy family transcriptional regulator of competence genes|nr:TfoX/Sxy family protein [Miltoncostaeales bacterium]